MNMSTGKRETLLLFPLPSLYLLFLFLAQLHWLTPV